MAIIERPSAVPTFAGAGANAPAVVTPTQGLGVFKRPVAASGWKSWVFTVDHKKLGIMYGVVSMFFFLVGGVEALLIRLQLAAPDNTVLSAQVYNEMFTMHATTMVFLFVMPMAAAFANYFLPLQIGARDVAFPRINALGFWLFLFGGIFINTSWVLGGAADGGWFMYSPNSSPLFSPGHGVDFWVLGLQITGIASLVGAINLIVTVLNMRAPGMKLMHMPMFTWMVLVVQFLLAFAMPVITVALFLLGFERNFGATFFNVDAGADPLLWQHLFWIFGHPEVYIIILPSFGIISEVLPVFARKPLFGYKFVVFSGAGIGFLGWGVWAHHMFASGLGPVSVAVFSVATMLIAIPTGVKIVNWTLTLWGGKLWFTTAMKFAIGVIVLFTIGGVTGVTHAVAPSDTQQTDTYHIVGHFHFVIVGGAVMGLFAGLYYWWPKMFGKTLNEKLGGWNFWLMFWGISITFGAMHIVGMQGQPRRMVVWPEKLTGEGFFNLHFWNQVATWGAFTIAVGVAFFIVNVVVTARKKERAPLDPWDARTLEWITASPPKEHNFDVIPTVHALDEFFHRKYEEVEHEDGHVKLMKVKTAEEILAEEEARADAHIHLPSPSYWPIVLAFGLPIIAYGVIYNLILSFVGAAIVLLAGFGWALEPSVAEDSDYDPPAGGDSTKELATIG
ncbi:MAG: cytochrome c oxidase subunit I [Ilumatobacteraceae bacterium]|nr:cytochrome c oxidase subunit I [Ilumatobacter sp.]MCB9380712.1 cytochrome c oxidase subunit I [Acidimicrobiaceae bacterium]MCO5329215.1 cytochrome c oxidase subunit I [Ilumatobacteraceae bacterium]